MALPIDVIMVIHCEISLQVFFFLFDVSSGHVRTKFRVKISSGMLAEEILFFSSSQAATLIEARLFLGEPFNWSRRNGIIFSG